MKKGFTCLSKLFDKNDNGEESQMEEGADL